MIPASPGTDQGRDLRAARAGRGGCAARGLRRVRHRGAGITVGSQCPTQEDGTPCPPRSWPSAQRRPGSPVPTLPGRLTESAPGRGRRLRTRGPRGAARACPAGPPLYLIRRRRRWEPGAGGRAGSASALPHLGGSEKPRATAPHLAGPPLSPTLPGRGGAPRWRGRGWRASLGLLEADCWGSAGAVGFSTFSR